MTESQAPVSVTMGRALAVAIAYLATATLGLLLASGVSSSITFVWLPSGLALAAVLAWGRAMLPAVFVGALLVNLFLGEASTLAAAMIATGNTIETIVAAHVLVLLRGRSPQGFRLHLQRHTQPFTEPVDLARLALAAFLGAAAAATIGTEALLATGAMTPAEWPAGWGLYCLGDFVGIFLVVPTVLIFLLPSHHGE